MPSGAAKKGCYPMSTQTMDAIPIACDLTALELDVRATHMDAAVRLLRVETTPNRGITPLLQAEHLY